MRIPALVAAACGMTLSLATPGVAQQQPPPPLDLGPLLLRARETKALDRVLGDRWFHLTSPRGEGLLRVRFVVVEDPPSLAYDSLLRTLDGPGAVSTQLVIGWDGQMQAFRTGLQGAGMQSSTEGLVQGSELKVTVSRDGQTREETFDWHAAAIPAPLAMFVLPSLIDQGIPPDGALFMQFDEQGVRFGARRVRGVRPDPSLGPGLNQVQVTMASPPYTPQFSAHLSPAGHVTQLLRGASEGMRIVLVAPAVAEKLMDRVVDFIPDPDPAPGAGSGAGSGADDSPTPDDGSGAEPEEGGSGSGAEPQRD